VSRLDGRATRGRLTGSPEKSLRGQGVSGPVSETRTHANQTRPTTHMQPAADCGQTAVVTHSASNPPTSPKVDARQSSVIRRYHPPLPAELELPGCLPACPDTRTLELLCSDPGLLLGPMLELGPEVGQTQDWRCQHRPVSVRVHSISVRFPLGHQPRRLLPANRDHPAIREHDGSA